MNILVVSGFLGAGKTTFIKELIRRTNENPVILENEYGDNTLDSNTLSEVGDLKILDFIEGCVCCSKKDTFANTILAISASLDPEYLIIEPTGVGKLSNIISNIKKVSYDRINILPPLLIISPKSISLYIKDFPDIFKDQVRYASQIIFSKIEHEDADSLAEAIKTIRAVNPDAPILNTPYKDRGEDWWHSLLSSEETPVRTHPGLSFSPPGEDIDQLTLHDVTINNISELIILLEDILRYRYGNIPRAKGIINTKNDRLRFDLADRLYAISGASDPDQDSQCVFIGTHIDKLSLIRFFNKTYS